jgi:hypothetical protein
MRRLTVSFVTAISMLALLAAVAVAGNAHFVGTPTLNSSTGTASGKVAGLGNIPQIHVEITADALCINPCQKHPKAANKASTGADTDVPVQNGKAEFSVQLPTPTFQPDCTPPMTVQFVNLQVTVSDPDGNVLLTYP